MRVTGRLRALGEPFVPPGESLPVVHCQTRFAQANERGTNSYRYWEDIRGLFLEVELSADTCVRIAPEAVRLLDGGAVVPEVGPELRWKLGAPGRGGGKASFAGASFDRETWWKRSEKWSGR